MTRDQGVALDWLQRFEGAGLDGVIAKPIAGIYLPGKRAMIKVKHMRTAECVVAGLRWHKCGEGTVGSLLLGLYDEDGVLQHVGVTSSFTMAVRRQLAVELSRLLAGSGQRRWWIQQNAGCSESLEQGEGLILETFEASACVRSEV